jgi:hypothetical protein
MIRDSFKSTRICSRGLFFLFFKTLCTAKKVGHVKLMDSLISQHGSPFPLKHAPVGHAGHKAADGDCIPAELSPDASKYPVNIAMKAVSWSKSTNTDAWEVRRAETTNSRGETKRVYRYGVMRKVGT